MTWRQRLNRLLRLTTGRASTIASSDTQRDGSPRSTRPNSQAGRGRSASRSRVPTDTADQAGGRRVGPLNSHPIMRFASPTRGQQEPHPRNQTPPSHTISTHRNSADSTDTNGATVHSDDYDLPLPRSSDRPLGAERREARESPSDTEDCCRYIPSVSSMLMDDVVSVNTVSSCTNPAVRREATAGSQTRQQSTRTAHGLQDSRSATRTVLSREAARAGWEKR